MGKESPSKKGAGDRPSTPRPNFPGGEQQPLKPAESQKK